MIFNYSNAIFAYIYLFSSQICRIEGKYLDFKTAITQFNPIIKHNMTQKAHLHTWCRCAFCAFNKKGGTRYGRVPY